MMEESMFTFSIIAPPLLPEDKSKLSSAFFSCPLPETVFDRHPVDFFVEGFAVSNGFENIPNTQEPILVNQIQYVIPGGHYISVAQIIEALALPADQYQLSGPELPYSSFLLVFKHPPRMVKGGFWAQLLNRAFEGQISFRLSSLGPWNYKNIFLECEGVIPSTPERSPSWIVNGKERSVITGFNQPVPILNPALNSWEIFKAQILFPHWRPIQLYGKNRLSFKVADENGQPIIFFERYVSVNLRLRRSPNPTTRHV